MVYTLFRRHGSHILRGEGIGSGFDPALVLIEEAEIEVEERDQPDVVVDLADSHELASEHLTEVDLSLADGRCAASLQTTARSGVPLP